MDSFSVILYFFMTQISSLEPLALLFLLLKESWYENQPNRFYLLFRTVICFGWNCCCFIQKELSSSYQLPTNGKRVKSLFYLSGSTDVLNAQNTCQHLGV